MRVARALCSGDGENIRTLLPPLEETGDRGDVDRGGDEESTEAPPPPLPDAAVRLSRNDLTAAEHFTRPGEKLFTRMQSSDLKEAEK